jgi:hypothetical protein
LLTRFKINQSQNQKPKSLLYFPNLLWIQLLLLKLLLMRLLPLLLLP